MLTTHWNARFHFHISITSLLLPSLRMHTSRSTPPSTVSMSRIRAEDVVRYARWFSELIKGSVEVQSSALRSYRVVVICTEALLTLGMLKLTSRILAHDCAGMEPAKRQAGRKKRVKLPFPVLVGRRLLNT